MEKNYFSFADAQKLKLERSVVERMRGLYLFQVAILVAQTRIIVLFTSRSASEIFAYRYHDLLIASNQAYTRTIRFYVVHEGTGLYLWSRPEYAWHVDISNLEAHIISFFADNAVMTEYIETHSVMALHSAVLAHRNRGCAIVGVSTSGKSTTAVAAATKGLTLLSDERCLLEDGSIIPFPRALTLRSNGRRRLLIDEGFTSVYLRTMLYGADSDDDFVIPPSGLFAQIGSNAVNLSVIFLISRYGEKPRIDSVDFFEALPELMLSMTLRERGLDRMARVVQEMQGLQIFRLTLGHPSDTGQMIADIMHHVA